jgi:DNA invertase Pin-like site-specific DNA recombinase
LNYQGSALLVQVVAYMRTSSTTNVGADNDSEKRQRAAIEAFAAARGFQLVGEFYDSAVSGADPVHERPGFTAMLDRIASNGARCIIVESPDRFARDLAVQLASHDFLKKLGVALIPATAPNFFMEDTPTAVLVRQVLGAISQFEKASLVAELKAARERKRAATGKYSGRKSLAETRPEVVELRADCARHARGGNARCARSAQSIGRQTRPRSGAKLVARLLLLPKPGAITYPDPIPTCGAARR